MGDEYGDTAIDFGAGYEAVGQVDVNPNGYVGATWRPVDLGPYLRGEVKREAPSVGIARKDGLQMLYAGKEHTVIGEMESGKSWFALQSVAVELINDRNVIYIHFEEADAGDTVERLQLLGVRDKDIDEGLDFIGPNEPLDQASLAALLEPYAYDIAGRHHAGDRAAPTLVVLDGINEAMSMNRLGIREEDGVAAFRRLLVKPFTGIGAAVLGCDHVVKDQEKRGRGPLGSIHKGNGLTGSLILLENSEPFGRGQRGASHVFVTKDRPGYLRRHGRASKLPGKTYMGTVVVDDTRTWVLHGVDLAFFEPPEQQATSETTKTQDEQDDEHVYGVVVAIVESGQQATLRTVRAKAGIGKDRVGDALTRCVLDGRLTERPGPNRSRLFGVADAPATQVES